MISHWQGQERLSLWLENPNVACAWLAMLAMLAIGAFLAVQECHWRSRTRWLFGVVLLCIVAFIFLLAGFTYSRGGYVAIFTGCMMAGVLQGRRCRGCWPRLRPLMPGFLFIGILTGMVPAGAGRLAAVGDTGDLSIQNRLAVWRGAAMLTHEYPLHGVGERPGRLYTVFYQPLGKNEFYNGMVGDFQTIASSYGLPLATGLLALLLSTVFWALATWWKRNEVLLLWMSAAIGVYLLAGVFTSCYVAPTVRWTLFVITVVTCGWAWRKGSAPRCFLRPCMAGLGTALVMAFLMWGVGGILQGRLPYRMTPGPQEAIVPNECFFTPRKPVGMCILLLYEHQEFAAQMDWERMLRRKALPLAENGYRILMVPVSAKITEEGMWQQVILRGRAKLGGGKYVVLVHGADVANLIIRAMRGIPIDVLPQFLMIDSLIPNHLFAERRIEECAWNGPIFLEPEHELDASEVEQLCRILPNLRVGTWRDCRLIETTY